MAPFPQRHLPAHLNPEKCKNVGGRPSEYRPEYCQMAIDDLSEGYSVTAFAGKLKVAVNTVYDWIKEHPEFSDAVARGRSARVRWHEAKLMRSRKGAETSAAIFALKNAAPAEWRDQKYTAHEHAVRVEVLSDSQLNAIAAGVAPSDAGIIDGTAERLGERDSG